jgi:hypothetical protein
VTPNETQLNSFLFNAFLLNAVTIAILQLCVLNLHSYTQGTTIFLISQKVKYSGMTLVVGGVNIFVYFFLGTIAITFVTLVFKGSKRLNFNKAIKEKSTRNSENTETLIDDKEDD